MPTTAAERNLFDPLNPIEALPKAAEFLKDCVGSLATLDLRQPLITQGPLASGHGWWAEPQCRPNACLCRSGDRQFGRRLGRRRNVEAKGESGISCESLMAKLKRPPTTFLTALQQHVVTGTLQPWGAILGADRSRPEILDRYAALQRRFTAILAGRDPILLERGRGSLPRYQVRVGAESRAAANDICKRIHLAGGDCVVLRNPGG